MRDAFGGPRQSDLEQRDRRDHDDDHARRHHVRIALEPVGERFDVIAIRKGRVDAIVVLALNLRAAGQDAACGTCAPRRGLTSMRFARHLQRRCRRRGWRACRRRSRRIARAWRGRLSVVVASVEHVKTRCRCRTRRRAPTRPRFHPGACAAAEGVEIADAEQRQPRSAIARQPNHRPRNEHARAAQDGDGVAQIDADHIARAGASECRRFPPMSVLL